MVILSALVCFVYLVDSYEKTRLPGSVPCENNTLEQSPAGRIGLTQRHGGTEVFKCLSNAMDWLRATVPPACPPTCRAVASEGGSLARRLGVNKPALDWLPEQRLGLASRGESCQGDLLIEKGDFQSGFLGQFCLSPISGVKMIGPEDDGETDMQKVQCSAEGRVAETV